MKKICTYLLAGSFIFGFMSCGNGGNNSTTAAQDSNNAKMDSAKDSGTAKAIPATVSKSDEEFAVNAANAGMTEIQAGKIAEEKGTDKEIKDLGKMMVTDHTEAADKLKDIAARKNITLPTSVSNDMQKALDDLQAKNGKDFDKAYTKMMVDDHKKVISSFQDESKNGSDADIRSFADSTLHTLQHHLDASEKCEKMVKKM